MKDTLLKKIEDRTIRAGVIGLGYVGLPLAVEKAKAGFRTTGFDVQDQKVAMVNAGQNYIGDVVDADLSRLVSEGILDATSDFDFVAEMDFIAICVPTPLDAHQQPDISYVKNSAESIAAHMKKGCMVVLESTTYPGTTEELIKPILEQGSGLVCGQDFYLGFSPERVDPGNLLYNTKNTPKVVGAIGQDAADCISAMYRVVLNGDIFVASSPAVAEMEKILENTYRNVNIGLVNELAVLCQRMGIDIWEVIEAAKTKPYGFQAFYPGPGLGGHCIPLDPYYLSWKAREYGFHTSMIESSMMVNDRMPEYCVERVGDLLNRQGKALNGANILQLGIAYKGNVADSRESPAVEVHRLLRKKEVLLRYYDPYVAQFRCDEASFHSEPALTAELLTEADLVVITTAHDNVNYRLVLEHAKCIFDTKNIMRNKGLSGPNLEVL